MMQVRRCASLIFAVGFLWAACTQSGGGGGGDGDSDTDTVDCGTTPIASGCRCNPTDWPEPVECYSGPPATQNVGACAAGTMQCLSDEREWDACRGQRLPVAESQPPNGIDDDCDGVADNGLCEPVDACNGSCCTETQTCYKGHCTEGGDADTDTDAECEAEQASATPCYGYYAGNFTCTDAADRVCVNGASGDCWPSDICNDCCGGSCQVQGSCGYYY